MLCERCKEREATFFLTRVVNGEKAEYHLCQQCAAETGQLGFMLEPQFTFTNFLAGLLNTEMGFAPAKPVPAAPQCRKCGLTYDDFRQVGQFACAHCYEEFEPYLEALFRRVQGGTEHTGKAPKGAPGRPAVARGPQARERQPETGSAPVPPPAAAPSDTRARVERLRQELSEAVAREDYERAAKLRDEIRALTNGEGK
ncbi:MAG: UvrB/UvrC motif-containing protein [Chitinophagales bacterium]